MSTSATEMLTPRADDSSSRRKNLFSIFLTGEFLSAPCYMFVLYHLLRDRNSRKSLQNHAIIALLILNLLYVMISLSFILDYMRLGYRSPFNIPLCLIHAYVDYASWYAALHVMLWISVERHILIFDSHLVATARGRLFFHYLLLSIVMAYSPVLYCYLVLLYPCQRVYNPNAVYCDAVCYSRMVPAWFNWFDSIVNYVLPNLMIAVFSCALIIRVVVQKRRSQQMVDWRRYRKMIIQLILVSIVYFATCLPYVIATIASWFEVALFGGEAAWGYLSAVTLIPAVLVPYANIFALPHLKQKLRSLMFWRKWRATVVPHTTAQ